MSTSPSSAVEIFYSYSHRDERFRNELVNHLANLRRNGLVRDWHDRKIGAGKEWSGEINEHLNSAQLILLLVSADFMASDYCNGVEVKRALERHEANEARVIPVLLRYVDWEGAPFAGLQALPKNGKPIASWSDRDKAFASVARGIREAIEQITSTDAPAMVQYCQGGSLAKKIRWALVLSATIEEVDMPIAEALVKHLRALAGDVNITLLRVEPGSVRLILESPVEVYETAKSLIRADHALELLDFEVQKIYRRPVILLMAHEADREYALQLQVYFHNIDLETIMIEEARGIEVGDVVVVVFGHASPTVWMIRRLEVLAKEMYARGHNLPIAVYAATPAAAAKYRGISFWGGHKPVYFIDNSTGFDSQELLPLLSEIGCLPSGER